MAHRIDIERLKSDLDSFYEQHEHVLSDVIHLLNTTNHPTLSIRRIDFVLTNFIVDHPIQYALNDIRVFDLGSSYKRQLKMYGKGLFDPFRRKGTLGHIEIKITPQKTLITTIAQLNFYRWCTKFNILEEITRRNPEIEAYMRKVNEQKKQLRRSKDDILSYRKLINKRKQVHHKPYICVSDHTISPISPSPSTETHTT